MKAVYFGLSITLLFASCASFSDKMIKNDKAALPENGLSRLEGTYELFADLKYDEKGNVGAIDSGDSKMHYNLNYFLKSQDVKYEYSEGYSVALKVINQDRLKLVTLKNNIKVDSTELGGKLKSDGLFYLDDTYLKSNGIPYLMGGYDNRKTRIGLTKDNGLLVNYAYDNSGAFLFLFWAGSTYNLGYHYKRIEDK